MAMVLRTWLLRVPLVAVLLSLLPAGSVDAQNALDPSTPHHEQDSSTPIYRRSVSEVRLVFFATDEKNHAVEELQNDDFAVVDNDRVIRDFQSFYRALLTNLDVIVLIDASESVQPHFKEEITDVVQLISQGPWGARDRLSVLSFSGMQARVVCADNCRSVLTIDRVASVARGGATPLFDALEVAADLLIQHRLPDVWPVIFLFSDGDDTVSNASFPAALEKILTSNAQVYAIEVGNGRQSLNGRRVMQRLAEDSGGRCLPIGKGTAKILSEVIDDLHSAHVVTYAPPLSSSDFHSVRILPTHNLKLQFRSRRGYYRPNNAP